MSPLLLKGLIGVGTASAIGTSGWGIIRLLEPKTLGEQLTSQGDVYPPMWEGADLTEWKKLAKRYKDNTTDTSIKFTDLSSISNDQDEAEVKKLRNECKKLYEKSLGQSDNVNDTKKLRKWCAISTTEPRGE